MKSTFSSVWALGALLFLLCPHSIVRGAYMEDRIHTATEILSEKQHSDEPIPASLLAHARGVAIFSLTKAGLGIGGQGGEGIILLHVGYGPTATWSAPSAINLAGGSIGAQIGFTQVRYIVILNTDDAVRHFAGSDQVTFDGTATGTAGSDTVREGITTSDLEHQEIVVYKDSSGVFGGATLGGTTISRKPEVNHEAYGDVTTSDVLSGKVPPPPYARRLYGLLNGSM